MKSVFMARIVPRYAVSRRALEPSRTQVLAEPYRMSHLTYVLWAYGAGIALSATAFVAEALVVGRLVRFIGAKRHVLMRKKA